MGKGALEELFEATLAFAATLSNVSMEELLSFVEKREQLIQTIGEHKYSAEERVQNARMLEELGDYDCKIIMKMEEYKREAATQLQNLADSRTRKAAYENPFEAESLFFDRKK